MTLLTEIVDADGHDEVIDPATGEVIGRTTLGGPSDVAPAVERAAAAQPGWASLGDEDRVSHLHRLADAIDARAEDLAQVLSREQGKPLNGPNARMEVGATASWLRATAALPHPSGAVVDDGDTHAEVRYRPVGVVGVITPWNWPMMIAAWQISPALRMGNTVVVKPSESTTLSGTALFRVMDEVLPPGVLQIVTGGGDVGQALVADPRIGKVMFTGSTATGRKIARAGADNLVRLTLELGGNDAGIVLADADPASIVDKLFWSAFVNAGQTCAALKRLYVPDSLYDAVVDGLVRVAEATPMGVGTDEANLLGPVQNRAQWEVVDRLVEDARRSGARIATGGDPDRGSPGHFYPATIVADVDDGAALVQEEQFGPVLPVVRYTDVDQAVAWANGVDVGLGASVWSSDRDRARDVAVRLEAGTVWINDHGAVHPGVPFGGVKQSGYGLEFGVDGLKAVAVPQVLNG